MGNFLHLMRILKRRSNIHYYPALKLDEAGNDPMWNRDWGSRAPCRVSLLRPSSQGSTCPTLRVKGKSFNLYNTYNRPHLCWYALIELHKYIVLDDPSTLTLGIWDKLKQGVIIIRALRLIFVFLWTPEYPVLRKWFDLIEFNLLWHS